jgi:hypothetical protein
MPLPNKIDAVRNRKELIPRIMIATVGLKGDDGLPLRWQLNKNNDMAMQKYEQLLIESASALEETGCMAFINRIMMKMSGNKAFIKNLEEQKKQLIEREEKILLGEDLSKLGRDIFEIEKEIQKQVLDHILQDKKLSQEFNKHIDDIYSNLIMNRAENGIAELIMNAVKTHTDKKIDEEELRFMKEKLNGTELIKFFEDIAIQIQNDNPDLIKNIQDQYLDKPEKAERKINEKILEYITKEPILSEKLSNFINDIKLALGIGGSKELQEKYYTQKQDNKNFKSFIDKLQQEVQSNERLI